MDLKKVYDPVSRVALLSKLGVLAKLNRSFHEDINFNRWSGFRRN